jgi:hypothetical protein
MLERGEREGVEIPCSADRVAAGEWGAFDLCLRLVDSRVGLPGGAVKEVVAAALWNKCAGARSPSWRCLWRSQRAAGCVCSGRGRRGEDGDRRMELLSPVSLFAAVRRALALLRRVWGWCGGALAVVVGCCCRFFRSLLLWRQPGARLLRQGWWLMESVFASSLWLRLETATARQRWLGDVSPPMFGQRLPFRRLRRMTLAVLQRSLAANEPWLFLGPWQARLFSPMTFRRHWCSARRAVRWLSYRTCRDFFVIFCFQ